MATTTISSSAYGLSSTVGLANTAAVTVGPTASVAGTASPGYAKNGSLASLNTSVGLGVISLVTAGLNLGTGIETTSATANGSLPGDTSSGSASALVNNLGIGLFTRAGVVLPITTLSIGADVLSSQTTVTRIGNSALLTGQSNFTNLNVSLLSLLNFGLGANAQVGPNFVVYDSLGLKITLNEQISGGNGSNILSLATNALHIVFNDFALSGRLLRGDVIVGHSEASINIDPGAPLPEPAIWAQLIVGFGLAGGLLRRRRMRLA